MQRRFVSAASASNTVLNALVPPLPTPSHITTPDQHPPTHSTLQGWTVAIKTNIATSSQNGSVTSCSSNILKDYSSPYSATVVSLLESHGAHILPSKANCDEFGMGSYNIHSAHGPVLNPTDTSRVSGGSSGGCAAAVASGLARVAIGTDTGGSVRMPASYCGVVGFKPTYGRFSRWGVVSYASSLDTVGVLANSVEDCEAVYGVLNSRDPNDPTSMPLERLSIPKRDESTKESLKGVTIGVPEHIPSLLPSATLERYSNALHHLESNGAKIVSIQLPHVEHALGAYYTIASAEASSNLARYDGVRFGSEAEGKGLEAVRDLFGENVKRRIMLGTFVLGSSSYASYFAQSQKIRRLIQQSYNATFNTPHPISPSPSSPSTQKCDYILTPATTTPAPKLEDVMNGDVVDECMDDVMTVPVSLAGLPALVVPVVGKEGELPVGMQLVGQFGSDVELFGVGRVLERLQ
ncbi:Trimeric GatFAB AmidoTransferase(AdT) complex subunit [Podochytrium sp. JEL0797]|nr:Trimeric GatFAB AmidoTransferase(AdT) complex subunit [Podochytrium sp. JEL0797]